MIFMRFPASSYVTIRLVYQGDLGVIRIMMSIMLLLYCIHTVIVVPLLAVIDHRSLNSSYWCMIRMQR